VPRFLNVSMLIRASTRCRPKRLAALPAASFDAIVMHSVAQYLTPRSSTAACRFPPAAGRDGLLILGDIIPPQVSAAVDAMALLRFAAANGFLGAAIVGLARTLASEYWRCVRGSVSCATARPQ